MRHCRLLLLFLLVAGPLLRSGFCADPAALNQQAVAALESGDTQKAVDLLTQAFDLAPDNQILKQNLSAAYHRQGIEASRNGNDEEAIRVLRKGNSLLPGNANLRGDLAALLVRRADIACRRRDFRTAEPILTEALALDSGNAVALCLLGDVHYGRQNLGRAREFWELSLRGDPSSLPVKQRLERLRKEIGVESRYSTMEAFRFDIRFDHATLGKGIFDLREQLMDSYRVIGQDLGYYPENPVVVILYGKDEFRGVLQVPEFVAGLFDGKIRVPVDYSQYPVHTLKAILRHEYTHALVYDLAGSGCPIWLNEGLAMHAMGGGDWADLRALKQAVTSRKTLSFSQLNDPAVWRNPQLLSLAYAQSWSMVDYLLYRWSRALVRDVLVRIRQGTALESVLLQRTGRTPEQFEKEWREYWGPKL